MGLPAREHSAKLPLTTVHDSREAPMPRQETVAKRTKRAATQAATIIEEATERATAKRCPVCRATGTVAELKAGGHGKRCTASAPQTDAKPRAGVTATAKVRVRPDNHSSDQGAECVRLRDDEQLSWMAIGAKLGLPGAKSGAAAARKLYAAHTGQSHTVAPTVARSPRASKRHAAQVGSKTSRREVVQRQGGFFSDDTTDEEVIALCAGKTVEWVIDLARLAGGKGEPQWAEQEARVHPTDLYVKDVNDERCLNFRTLEGRYEDGKPIAGPTRTVRLAAIHTVR